MTITAREDALLFQLSSEKATDTELILTEIRHESQKRREELQDQNSKQDRISTLYILTPPKSLPSLVSPPSSIIHFLPLRYPPQTLYPRHRSTSCKHLFLSPTHRRRPYHYSVQMREAIRSSKRNYYIQDTIVFCFSCEL